MTETTHTGGRFLNQSGALINVYTDGSVLLSHGGTEMGQGLHTKMLQVASQVSKQKLMKNEEKTQGEVSGREELSAHVPNARTSLTEAGGLNSCLTGF